jgi:hypothetical protein
MVAGVAEPIAAAGGLGDVMKDFLTNLAKVD